MHQHQLEHDWNCGSVPNCSNIKASKDLFTSKTTHLSALFEGKKDISTDPPLGFPRCEAGWEPDGQRQPLAAN